MKDRRDRQEAKMFLPKWSVSFQLSEERGPNSLSNAKEVLQDVCEPDACRDLQTLFYWSALRAAQDRRTEKISPMNQNINTLLSHKTFCVLQSNEFKLPSLSSEGVVEVSSEEEN
ncbi:unnamed protein product [Eretmochelys imbricata]